jgi:type IV pilus assembly protein PilA
MTKFGQIRRDPLKWKNGFSKHKGFTLIELMIIAAAFVIILAMAVPAYSNFSIRAKISESLFIVSPAKRSIIFACKEDATITNLSTATIGLNFKATEYISHIEFGGDCDAPTIKITTKATGAQPDPVLTITGDFAGDTRRMTWTCVSDGLNAHVPESCQS